MWLGIRSERARIYTTPTKRSKNGGTLGPLDRVYAGFYEATNMLPSTVGTPGSAPRDLDYVARYQVRAGPHIHNADKKKQKRRHFGTTGSCICGVLRGYKHATEYRRHPRKCPEGSGLCGSVSGQSGPAYTQRRQKEAKTEALWDHWIVYMRGSTRLQTCYRVP